MTCPRLSCWLAMAALALLVALFWPAESQASCGDYVQMSQLTMPASTSSPHLPPKPCHGPLCSHGNPEMPVVPLAPTVIGGTDCACIGILALAPRGADFPEDISDHVCRPIHRPSDVFHPPRRIHD